MSHQLVSPTPPTIPGPLGHLPVAVIGAGPIGLAAAAHLSRTGRDFEVLEAGPTVAANVRDWGHVRLFSPWSMLIDTVARDLLARRGWTAPSPDALPTGDELVTAYLEPLAAIPAIAAAMRYSSRVVTVTRAGHDKVRTGDRSALPFLLRVDTPAGPETRMAAAVIDASGTWGSFNPLGSGGVPAPGEAEAADRISYRIPDLLGDERADYTGRTVLVVGSGHSAANAILDLVSLAGDDPATTVVWAIRGPDPQRVYGTVGDDRLPARQGLGARLRSEVEAGRVSLHTGFSVDRVRSGGGKVGVVSLDGREIRADRVIAVTGQRPRLDMTRELRLDLDPRLESPRRLAPLIDPDVHTCGTVEPHGHEMLGHPEPGYFTAGIKSYGRAPTFLTVTGYHQVRSVVEALTAPAPADSPGSVPGVVHTVAACSC